VKAMTDGTVDTLLADAIDMHVHGSPDVLPRKLHDIDIARKAKEGRLAGVLLKCHHCPTAARAFLVQQCIPGIAVFGSVVLNRNVGGLNPFTVETEVKLGAKEVWLPTVSSVNHIRFNKGDLRLAVPVTGESGRLLPQLHEVLEVIAQTGVILGTGHLTPDESEQVIIAAQAKGVKKILVTHPEWEVTAMPVDQQERLARRGVFFERCFYASNSDQRLPAEEIARQIRKVGAATTVLSSDFGQIFNEEPLQGFRRFIQTMLQHGITPGEIEVMIKTNPRSLLQ